MAHHIALVEISPRPWTAGICFAASQVERRPILFTGSHLCVQETWWFWWDSDLHMETKKKPQRLQANPFEKKNRKKKRSALNLLLIFSKKNIYHFLVHFTLPLNFGCFLGGLGNSMSEGSTTGPHGEAWNLPGNHLAFWSRDHEAKAGWGGSW